jgi:hypothetical protein
MNRRLTIVASIGILVLIVTGVGIYILSRRHVESIGAAPTQSFANSASPNVLHADAAASVARVKLAAAPGLWARPPAKVAARSLRRCSLGATLKPLGASDSVIERISDGDMRAVVAELKQQAQAGDSSATNQLFYIAYLTCAFAGTNGAQSDYQASQLIDANGMPPVRLTTLLKWRNRPKCSRATPVGGKSR